MASLNDHAPIKTFKLKVPMAMGSLGKICIEMTGIAELLLLVSSLIGLHAQGSVLAPHLFLL